MGTIERQTSINVASAAIFTYVSDVAKHPDWASHQLEVTPKATGPVAVGSAFETVGHQFGEQPGTVTITELVPNSRVVYESNGKVGHFRHGFIIKDNGDGTSLVTKTMEMIEVRSLPLKVFSPIVSSFIAPKGLDGDLARIKEKLEASKAV